MKFRNVLFILTISLAITLIVVSIERLYFISSIENFILLEKPIHKKRYEIKIEQSNKKVSYIDDKCILDTQVFIKDNVSQNISLEYWEVVKYKCNSSNLENLKKSELKKATKVFKKLNKLLNK